MLRFISHRGGECAQFFDDYLSTDKRALFVGTLGFNDLCLYFPQMLASRSNIDFLFLIEERTEVSPLLVEIAHRNKAVLESTLAGRRVLFQSVVVVADDTAIIAGRSAAKIGRSMLTDSYSEVFVDATAMSRGVCFPMVKQALEFSLKSRAPQIHLLVASRARPNVRAAAMSSDTPQYMHGFQSDMDLDDSRDSVRLWIPQLSEKSSASLERIHRKLQPEESCPILPFPSADPCRGDRLLQEFRHSVLNEWQVNLLDLIYAHESDPNDVCETIGRIHVARHDVLCKAMRQSNPDRTVLSPAGTRIGSIGMLLAALQLDLPIMYEESIGYTTDTITLPSLTQAPPDHVWHVWFRP